MEGLLTTHFYIQDVLQRVTSRNLKGTACVNRPVLQAFLRTGDKIAVPEGIHYTRAEKAGKQKYNEQ